MNKPKRKRDFEIAARNEEALVGSVLLDPSRLDAVPHMTSSQFLDPQLGSIFDICRKRYEAGHKIDPVLVLHDSQAAGIDVSAAEIAKLFTAVPHAAHARWYGDNVVEADRLRQLAEVSAHLSSSIGDPTKNADAIISEIESSLEVLRRETQAQAVSLHEAGNRLIAECRASANRKRSAETGITSIDCRMGAMMPGEMIVLAARPAVGKTAFAFQVSKHNATLQRSCLFVSLEMRSEELAARVFGGQSSVSSSDIRSRSLIESQETELRRAVDSSIDQPIYIFDPSMASIRDIRAQARAHGDLSLIVIDYLSLVSPADKRAPRWEQVSHISRCIKQLAKELKVPILALQQLSRDADGAIPRLSHLRESGAIEQDADIVCFLHFEKQNSKHQFIVAKHRHGPTSVTDLSFEPRLCLFSDSTGF